MVAWDFCGGIGDCRRTVTAPSGSYSCFNSWIICCLVGPPTNELVKAAVNHHIIAAWSLSVCGHSFHNSLPTEVYYILYHFDRPPIHGFTTFTGQCGLWPNFFEFIRYLFALLGKIGWCIHIWGLTWNLVNVSNKIVSPTARRFRNKRLVLGHVRGSPVTVGSVHGRLWHTTEPMVEMVQYEIPYNVARRSCLLRYIGTFNYL